MWDGLLGSAALDGTQGVFGAGRVGGGGWGRGYGLGTSFLVVAFRRSVSIGAASEERRLAQDIRLAALAVGSFRRSYSVRTAFEFRILARLEFRAALKSIQLSQMN